MEDRNAILETRFPEYSFAVERGKIREFALAIGDPREICLDPEKAAQAGYADVAAPPTFGIAVDLWGGPDFARLCEILKADPVKVLHGEQEYEYLGDIVAGDVLTVRTSVTDHAEKRNMRLITLRRVYVNQRNEEVLRCRTVVVELK
ncbi:MAG: MaoC family dehydratase N-terminal domain-containing protein [Peptococcaceae bacterium]|nr:MaoC family dehydratase N-terminal domain-containing protein [Peptococcaceae bacterium]